MHLNTLISPFVPALALGLSACAPTCGEGVSCAGGETPDALYLGVETRLLEDDLVRFNVAMRGNKDDPNAAANVSRYAECAAAQYALIRGYGFARHLRTTTNFNDGTWSGDAAYTISSSLPDGLKTIDAEVIVADCKDNGIPTV
ncbi:hypothetical protein [uncultured Shimia sp.]|uniref:hypothetical protein n=1 Tax=uncultured Shimia sp. TaxID=573152 RepID=UPI0026321032|nr:hypothetical protein [uncultured Shimia sp.]